MEAHVSPWEARLVCARLGQRARALQERRKGYTALVIVAKNL